MVNQRKSSQTYLITGTGVTESSFDFLSAPAGGNGPYFAAIHVQNTPGGGGQSAFVQPGTPSSARLPRRAVGPCDRADQPRFRGVAPENAGLRPSPHSCRKRPANGLFFAFAG